MPESLKAPAPTSIDDTLTAQLRILGQGMRRQYREGSSRYRIMTILLDRKKISQQELKAILEVKSGSLSELLAKLEKKSLVRREKNETDKRNRDIVLTEEGRNWLRNHAPVHLGASLFSVLSEDEKMQLSALLGKLLATDDKSPPNAEREDNAPDTEDEPISEYSSTEKAAEADDPPAGD